MKQLISAAFRLFARIGRKYFSQRKPEKPLPQSPRRILWIRLDHIGDGVMSMPALAALRAKFPNAEIDALILPSFAPLLRELSLADRIIVGNSFRFPNRPGAIGRLRALYETYTLARRMRGRYDLAIDVRGDDVARLIAYWSGTPNRLGPDRIFYEPDHLSNLSFLMTHLTSVPQTPQHAVINNLENLKPLGVKEVPFSWPITKEQKQTVEDLLKQLGVIGNFAVVHARSNDPERDWEVHRFAEVADYLTLELNLKVLICGAEKDFLYNEQIIAATKNPKDVYNIAGEISLSHLIALLHRAKIMVSVDTGPMHLGAMACVPIVALMLPNLTERHHPWKQPNATISAPDGKMSNISTDEVKAKIRSVLDSDNLRRQR